MPKGPKRFGQIPVSQPEELPILPVRNRPFGSPRPALVIEPARVVGVEAGRGKLGPRHHEKGAVELAHRLPVSGRRPRLAHAPVSDLTSVRGHEMYNSQYGDYSA